MDYFTTSFRLVHFQFKDVLYVFFLNIIYYRNACT